MLDSWRQQWNLLVQQMVGLAAAAAAALVEIEMVLRSANERELHQSFRR